MSKSIQEPGTPAMQEAMEANFAEGIVCHIAFQQYGTACYYA